MRKFTPLVGLLASTILATSAIAQDVVKASPQSMFSGGLNGNGPGCLYITTDKGNFTYPLALIPPSIDGMLALEAGLGILEHPLFGTLSFDLDTANPAVCKAEGWADAKTIRAPGTP